MTLPAGFPAEDAAFDGIQFWELYPDGRAYAAVPTDLDRTSIGQTVIGRFTKPVEVTLLGLCGLDEAGDFDGAGGIEGTLDWHRGTETALCTHVETKRIPALDVAEVTLTVVLEA